MKNVFKQYILQKSFLIIIRSRILDQHVMQDVSARRSLSTARYKALHHMSIYCYVYCSKMTFAVYLEWSMSLYKINNIFHQSFVLPGLIQKCLCFLENLDAGVHLNTSNRYMYKLYILFSKTSISSLKNSWGTGAPLNSNYLLLLLYCSHPYYMKPSLTAILIQTPFGSLVMVVRSNVVNSSQFLSRNALLTALLISITF